MKVDPSMWLAMCLVAASTGCQLTGGHNLPPSERLAAPGPGVGGPGPGVMMMPTPTIEPASVAFDAGFADGGIPGDGAGCLDPGGLAGPVTSEVQVLFGRPQSMQVSWDSSGSGHFDSMPMVTPARKNFMQGGIYRLKLTQIPGHEGVELYPTLEIGPGTVRTAAFLSHNAIPVQFTSEDLDQVSTGNFVTKVLYLPDPEFQELALAGVETLVSTRLDPGLDPIVEADRRGTILAVVRIGNKDLETPGLEGGFDESVIPAGYNTARGGAVPAGYRTGGCPTGRCNGTNRHPCCSAPAMTYPAGSLPPGGLPPGLMAQGYAPQYGMPITGTPIGLPGPPHIPLGNPAGLQRHVMKNHTRMWIPDPTKQVKINVQQRPGMSYPQPANRAWVKEDTIQSTVRYPYKHFGAPPQGHVKYRRSHH